MAPIEFRFAQIFVTSGPKGKEHLRQDCELSVSLLMLLKGNENGMSIGTLGKTFQPNWIAISAKMVCFATGNVGRAILGNGPSRRADSEMKTCEEKEWSYTEVWDIKSGMNMDGTTHELAPASWCAAATIVF